MRDLQLDQVLQTLEQTTKFKPIRRGNGWMAICPNHQDEKPSLSIAGLDDGRALVHCFAGCAFGDVARHLSEETTVVFWEKPENEELSELDAMYIYRDETGKPVMRKLRFKPKAFALQGWDGSKWGNSVDNITPVLYNLPAVIKADTVFIVEGEKAADRLAEWGVVATCIYNGASKSKENPKWLEHYTPYFENKTVVLLPDNDEPGKVQMDVIAKEIAPIAKSVKIINLPVAKKADFYDWAEVGHTIDELRELWSAATELKEAA